MHDDDASLMSEPEDSQQYWTEVEWERFMVENERLMDRYEQVWKDNPNRRWDDPLDLYYKVHYDLDLGEESASPPPSQMPELTGESAKDIELETPSGFAKMDDVRQISAYQLAYRFSLAVLDYVKVVGAGTPGADVLMDELCRHGLRIAADIAGGHGMGYEEEVLCGNIVKNRWALGHAQEAQRLFQRLIEREGFHPDLMALLTAIPPIIKALEERIAKLRAKVWWDQENRGWG